MTNNTLLNQPRTTPIFARPITRPYAWESVDETIRLLRPGRVKLYKNKVFITILDRVSDHKLDVMNMEMLLHLFSVSHFLKHPQEKRSVRNYTSQSFFSQWNYRHIMYTLVPLHSHPVHNDWCHCTQSRERIASATRDYVSLRISRKARARHLFSSPLVSCTLKWQCWVAVSYFKLKKVITISIS